ncbi:hypothetical protein [uncultured Enterovirga sp.]|uniref:hypothetical protein n=1 Tax=uncultured Enterovirga sp. TaxID=2026352 RepID=UPI0035CAED1C
MMVARLRAVPIALTDIGIAVGLGLAVACPRILALDCGRLVRRGAEFSFSLYALHVPVAIMTGALLESVLGRHGIEIPGPWAYSAFALALAVVLLVSDLFARLTEDRTEAFRSWLSRLVPTGRRARRAS